VSAPSWSTGYPPLSAARLWLELANSSSVLSALSFSLLADIQSWPMSRTHRCSWSTDDAISCTLHFFAPATSTLTRWPSYTNLTSILSMCTRRPKLNFLPQLSSYRGQKSLTQYNIVSKNCQCILSYLRENRMVSNPLIGWEYTRRRWTFPPQNPVVTFPQFFYILVPLVSPTNYARKIVRPVFEKEIKAYR